MEKKYDQLNGEERNRIHRLLGGGSTVNKISKELGRHRSTIYREIKRNRSKVHEEYLPDTAEELSRSRRYRKPHKIESSKWLQKEIEVLLTMEKSPEIIAGRLKLEAGKHIISHESIYKWIYGPVKHLKLQRYLLRKKRKRGRRPSRNGDKTKIPNRVSIHERPAEHSKGFGNWEGDTIHFANHQGGIVTVYERICKLTLGAKMDTLTSSETLDNMETIFKFVPAIARKSATLDNGKEFTDHQRLNERLNMKTYFCDPHSPWQKGGIENVNGIIRRYVPKRSRAQDYSAEKVQHILNTINHTPRKSLDFKTPWEAYLTILLDRPIVFNCFTNLVALQI